MAKKNYEFTYKDGSPLLTRPLFIDFEGIDGSGKDEQFFQVARLIRDDDNGFLGNKYSFLMSLREPSKHTSSGVFISNAIRERDVSMKEASKNYIADGIELSQKLIKQNTPYFFNLQLRHDLSRTYQVAQGASIKDIYDAHKYGANGTIIPDITLYFKLPVKVAMARTAKRNGVEECFEKEEFQKKLGVAHESYINYLKVKQPNRYILTINANQSIKDVTVEVANKISDVVRNDHGFFKPSEGYLLK